MQLRISISIHRCPTSTAGLAVPVELENNETPPSDSDGEYLDLEKIMDTSAREAPRKKLRRAAKNVDEEITDYLLSENGDSKLYWQTQIEQLPFCSMNWRSGALFAQFDSLH